MRIWDRGKCGLECDSCGLHATVTGEGIILTLSKHLFLTKGNHYEKKWLCESCMKIEEKIKEGISE